MARPWPDTEEYSDLENISHERDPQDKADLDAAARFLGITDYKQIDPNPNEPCSFWLMECEPPFRADGRQYHSGRAWTIRSQYVEIARSQGWDIMSFRIHSGDAGVLHDKEFVKVMKHIMAASQETPMYFGAGKGPSTEHACFRGSSFNCKSS
jgi:hypothetical protein